MRRALIALHYFLSLSKMINTPNLVDSFVFVDYSFASCCWINIIRYPLYLRLLMLVIAISMCYQHQFIIISIIN